jgi:hypothetical protein
MVKLKSTVFARVLGEAQVFDNARVFGNVVVCGNARIYGEAKVCGDALVEGSVHVFGASKCEKTPIVTITPDFILTITDDLIHVGDDTYTPTEKLPIPEVYREMVRRIFLERRESFRDPRSFWEKL